MQEDIIQLINAIRVAVSTKAKRDATSAFLEAINPKIYLYFAARVSDHDAQDLRSITLLEICKGVEKIKGDTSRIAWGWCYAVARRKLANYFEEKEISITDSIDPELLDDLEGTPTGAMSVKRSDLRMDVMAALQSLRISDPDCFFLLWDLYVVGIDYEEVAQRTEKSANAVRMKASRCADKMGPLLN